jgi:transcriptional regulator with XRE-family HTH domain
MLDQKQLDLLSRAVAEELRTRRESANLSKNQVATASGLAVSFVSYLESGLRKPTVETLARLASVYGTTTSDLLRSSEDRVGQRG